MKHLLTVIIGSVIAATIFLSVDWDNIDFSLSTPLMANTPLDSAYLDTITDQIEMEEDVDLWIDTVMYAKGHSFGYSGDISMWGGWYFDTIFVGEDRILTYDSVGPSTLRLGLVTRELIVDLGDPTALVKIRGFMEPIAGFRRFQKSYEECLDSVVDEEYGTIRYMGSFSFEADYPDSCNKNAGKINRFIGELAGISENEKAMVSGLSAFYAGFNPTKYYRPAYTGQVDDMQCLSDFLAHRTFENWIRGGNFGMGSSGASLAIRPNIVNGRYATLSKYEYECEGIGHGMYTETFHSFDLKNGTKLSNRDIFKSKSLNKVKMKLFEVMAKDSRYLEWHGGNVSPTDIEDMILDWQSPSSILEGTEWEEPKRDVKFELPEGALTESGVVFSFQPYEIECWAAGTFHFIVPYKEVMPYLTPKAKRLINASKSK